MQETEVIGVVRKGQGGVASLILRKCQLRSQFHKGEIKVQETQEEGGSWEASTQPEKEARVQSIKPVKLTCHYIKRAVPRRYIITLTIPFWMTEFPQLTRFLQYTICIINKSFMCHSCYFYSFA